MKNHVDRLVGRCETDRPQHGFGIFNIDVAAHGDSEEADSFLPVNHCDHARFSLLLKLIEDTDSGSVRPIRSENLLDHHVGHNQPKREPHAAKPTPSVAPEKAPRLRMFILPFADVLCFHIVKAQLSGLPGPILSSCFPTAVASLLS